jgi:hypothetical protein
MMVANRQEGEADCDRTSKRGWSDALTEYSLVLSGCRSNLLLGEWKNPPGPIPQLSIYTLHTAGLQVGFLLEGEGDGYFGYFQATLSRS